MAAKNQSARSRKRQRSSLVSNLDVITIDVTADASAGKTVALPFPIRIIDVVLIATATSALGTMKLTDGTHDITDAMACATLDTQARASTIDVTYSKLYSGNIVAVGSAAAVRGTISIIVERL